jgi:Na+-transporting methylmalonyl-CoA/oxaloacetate decarboxylase gamma subunit
MNEYGAALFELAYYALCVMVGVPFVLFLSLLIAKSAALGFMYGKEMYDKDKLEKQEKKEKNNGQSKRSS